MKIKNDSIIDTPYTTKIVENTIPIDFYTLCDLIRKSAKLEIAMNCIKNGVPYEWSTQVFDID